MDALAHLVVVVDRLIVLVVLSFAISAISMTISKSKLFEGFREWIGEQSGWLGELFNCPYCTSHWVTLLFVILFKPEVVAVAWRVPGMFLFNYVVSGFAIVALASFWSGIIYRAFSHEE